jgi:hypothetical protein
MMADNKLWVCTHCGKASDDRYKLEDPTCVLNAQLFFTSMLKFNDKGLVEEIIELPPEIEKNKAVAPRRKKTA